MTKRMGFVVAIVAVMGVTLGTPASSEACGWRRSRCYYVEPCCYSYPVVNCCPTTCCYTPVVPCCASTGVTVVAPVSTTTYYPTGAGYYVIDPAYSSGYYRGGHVIYGRRW
jgi:hypothetical protein